MITVKLYTTLGCHLCEEAALLLSEVSTILQLSITEVEIAEDDALIEQYGVRIPVIQASHRQTDLGWPFGLSELKNYLLQDMVNRKT